MLTFGMNFVYYLIVKQCSKGVTMIEYISYNDGEPIMFINAFIAGYNRHEYIQNCGFDVYYTLSDIFSKPSVLGTFNDLTPNQIEECERAWELGFDYWYNLTSENAGKIYKELIKDCLVFELDLEQF